MLARVQLRKIARARVRDADALFRARRYDGAVYLCGYAVECILKARICVTLKWPGFPVTSREFESFKSFKTHDFDTLLALSGCEAKVKTRHMADWSTVGTWEPEIRYKPAGSATRADARAMIQATKALLAAL